MLPIRGIYEVAIRVRDLARSETFYRDVLGLEVGIRDDARKWLFLRAGGEAGMLVLQETPGDWPLQHFAFTVAEEEIDRSVAILREKGVAVGDSVVHDWMPAKSVYFADPDGNDLELCAPLRLCTKSTK
jgi:catechol 2,3-dioxygenase-like lactoylglutathione lyase family enzyme